MQNKRYFTYNKKPISLVPYLPHFTPVYHSWMLSDVLQEQTKTPPQTFQQIQQTQKVHFYSKLHHTFIILYENIPIGDVNIMQSEWLEDNCAEIDIMIIENYQNKKIGTSILEIVLNFMGNILGLQKWLVKISIDNERSRKVFQKLGFEGKVIELLEEWHGEKLLTKNQLQNEFWEEIQDSEKLFQESIAILLKEGYTYIDI